MTEEQVREKCNTIKVHTPTLKGMNPFPELLNMACPWGLDGQCGSCDHFQGMIVEDGMIAAYMSYEGFCEKQIKLPEMKLKEV